MEAGEVIGFIIATGSGLAAVVLAFYGIRTTRPLDQTHDCRRDELLDCLQKLAERGPIHTRINAGTSMLLSSGWLQLNEALTRGCLSPLRDHTQVHFRLWEGNDTTVVVAQHSRSIHVFKVHSDPQESTPEWAAAVVASLKRHIAT